MLADTSIRHIHVTEPVLLYALFLPLGENGIINLVDTFRSKKLEILHTDLYYNVQIKHKEAILTFYSKGLITVEFTSNAKNLDDAIDQIQSKSYTVASILKSLLNQFQLSLVEVFGDLSKYPIHQCLKVDGFQGKEFSYINSLGNLSEEELDEHKDNLLLKISNNAKVQVFLEHIRSVDSRPHEDIIIGTNGSIIRSDQLEKILSYHLFNRSLHLLLHRFREILEDTWNRLHTDELKLHSIHQEIRQKNGLFSSLTSNTHGEIGSLKSQIIIEGRHINSFLTLSKYIREAITDTQTKYIEQRNSGTILENSFHIRKVIQILKDRATHLIILSDSVIIKSQDLLTTLDLYDSEVVYRTHQKMEQLALLTGTLGVVLALIAIFLT